MAFFISKHTRKCIIPACSSFLNERICNDSKPGNSFNICLFFMHMYLNVMAIILNKKRCFGVFPSQKPIINILLTWLHKKAGLHVGSFDLTKRKVICQKSAQHLLHRTFLLGIFEEFHHAAERKGKIVLCTYKQPHIHMKNYLFLPPSHLTNGE